MSIGTREFVDRNSRRVCIVMMLVLLAMMGWGRRDRLMAGAYHLYLDERCRFHRPGAGVVIYDESRRLADTSPWTLGFEPWGTLLNGRTRFGHNGVLIGEYRTSRDKAFLIGIEMCETPVAETQMPGEPRSMAIVAVPRFFGQDGWGSEPVDSSVQIWVPELLKVKLLDVRPDPQRQDRFTIGYTCGFYRGILSGTLADDGSVTIDIDSGPALVPTPRNTPYLIQDFDGVARDASEIKLGESIGLP